MIPAIQEYNNVTQQNRLASYATLHQATVSLQEMGERTISTQVRIDGSVVPDFNGWELRFKGERFVLNTKDPQAMKDNTTRNSLVDLTFTSWVINELKRYYFFEPSTIDAGTVVADKYKASIGLNVEDFVVMVNKVLGYYFGGKVVMSLYLSGQGHYSTDRVYQDIDYTYIWDLLTKFYESFGVRWRIEYNATTDVYTIKAGYPAPEIDDHDFEYGYQGGLLKFERQVQDVDIRNILLGRGGEKNLPYRYFKLQDPQNPEWAADPDAIPELASITFDRLRDINFRWYVRGWMQNSHRDTSWDATHTFPSYTDNDCPPEYLFAFQKGKTDEKFNPVEYVKDDESIADYGERWGAVEDNDDVYPTIQGVSRSPIGRIDEMVAVSEIVTDDIEAMSKNTAIETSMNPLVISDKNSTATQHTLLSETFTIPTGKTGNITYAAPTSDVPDADEGLNYVDTAQTTMVAVNQSTGTEVPISGIPAGTYRLKINLVIHIGASSGKVTGTFGYETIKLTTSEVDADAWKPTFDIWIKNIWNTTKRNDESEVQYAERVWLPILGDRAGNEAKVVFSTGFMSISEDYEFVIVSYPVHDTSKEINGVPSEWRITLRKSDAEFDATGLYIPNATTGGAPVAGDKFFFMGIDMPHMYVELSEEDLNTAKSAQLESTAATNKTWVINLDKVRCNTLEDGEYGQTLADRLSAGAEVWITDPRFTPGTRLKLFVQSITYTWNEPAENTPYIVPDIEVVLSDKVLSTESTIGKMQGDIAMVKEQYARISDVEAAVRSVTEPMFLKKTGESDTSASPTQFASKVTSKGFRQGGVGGAGWGLYRDNTSDMAEGEDEAEGDSVIEVDRVIVRKAMEVNSLVVNQIEAQGGKEILSAAKIEVTKVIENNTSYVCYFNQRQGSVANLFAVNDIAMGQVFGADNTELRYYKMLVTAVGLDNITLAKANRVGSGSPSVGDVIVQYGSITNTARQYVIIRDVIGGGYERMLSGLNSLNSDGDEYFFAGRQSSNTKVLVGDEVSQAGEFMRWLNGVLDVKGRFVVRKNDNTYQSMADFIDNNDVAYLKEATNNGTTLVDGGLILSNLIAIGQTVNNQYQVRGGINGMMNIDRTRRGGGVAAWFGGPMSDLYDLDQGVTDYAKTLFRFDGSGYLAKGHIYWDENGYGGIPGITWSRPAGSQNDVITIGADVMLEQRDGTDSKVTDLLTLVQSISNMFEDESYTEGGQTRHRIKVKSGFAGLYSEGFISGGGVSSGGGQTPGNASLQLITGGGRITNGTDTLDVYSMSKVDQLIAGAGTVQTVAGVSPVSGDVPVASLQTALGFSNYYTKTQVDNLIGAIDQFHYEIYASTSAVTNPQSNVLYLIGPTGSGADKYEEYVYANSTWTKIGDTSIDLSGYMLTSSFTAANIVSTLGTTAVNRATADASGNNIANTYATITALNGVSGRVTTLEGRQNWDDIFGIDSDGNIYVKKRTVSGQQVARGFYSYGFVSGGGLSSGGGASGIDLDAMWTSLTTTSDAHGTDKIHTGHLPTLSAGTGLTASYTQTSATATTLNLGINASQIASAIGLGDYLPLTAGSGKMLTDDLWINKTSGTPGFRAQINSTTVGGLEFDSSNTVTLYSQGSYFPQLKLKSGVAYPVFRYNSVENAVYHSGNSNKSDVAWSAASLTLPNLGTIIGANGASLLYNGSSGGVTSMWLGDNGTGNITLRTGSDIIFHTNSTERARIDSNGVVYIGGDLRFRSPGSGTYNIGTIFCDANSFTIEAPLATDSATGTRAPIRFGWRGGNYPIIIGSNTNVGVGTPTPGYKLDVNGTLNATTIYQNGTTLANTYLALAGGTMSSTNVVTNLNADLLDGQHGSYYDTLVTFYDSGATSADSVTYPLSLLRSGTPSSTWWYVTTMYYSFVGSPQASQIATSYNASEPQMYIRQKYNSTWSSWREVYHSGNFNPANYLPLTGGTISSGSIYSLYLNNSASGATYVGQRFQIGGTTYGSLIVGTDGVLYYGPNNGAGQTVYHSGNSNKSDVAWTCSSAYVYGNVDFLASGTGTYNRAQVSVNTSRMYLELPKATDSATGTNVPFYMCWRGGGTRAIYVAGNANVGIGLAANTVPTYRLDVNSASVGDALRLTSGTTYSCIIYVPSGGTSVQWSVGCNNSSQFYFYSSSAIRAYLTQAGNFVATGAVTGGQASDLRLKTNIASMTNEQAKALIMALRPVTFTWNQKATELYDEYKGNDLGFVAQEVEGVQNMIPGLSKAIGTIFEDYKRLDPVKFIAPMVKVAQNHETRIQQLERELAQVKNENKQLRNRLNMS